MWDRRWQTKEIFNSTIAVYSNIYIVVPILGVHIKLKAVIKNPSVSSISPVFVQVTHQHMHSLLSPV